MGKRRTGVERRKKRAIAAANELLEDSIEKNESEKYEAMDDGNLFVLDTTGSQNKRRKLSDKESGSKSESVVKAPITANIKQTKRNRVSEKDERQIRKLMNTHSNEAIVSIAAGREKREKERKRAKRTPGSAKASFDLWDDSIDSSKKSKGMKLMPVTSGVASMAGTAPIQFQAVSKSSLRKDIQQPATASNKLLKNRKAFKANAPKSVKVEPAHGGQSYRPDAEQHQDVIGEALSIELRRKEALDYKNTPLGEKLLDETLALMVNNSDEDSSDDEEDESENGEAAKILTKRKEKLTRAQRNKQKRVTAERVALEDRRSKKKFLHGVHEAKIVAKQVRKEEAVKTAKREEMNVLKEEKRAQPIGTNIFEKMSERDPVNAPSLPVALTSELKDGSLRTVRPKGSLLTDRMESMINRKMANKKALRKKHSVHGKKRKMKGGQGREFLLA